MYTVIVKVLVYRQTYYISQGENAKLKDIQQLKSEESIPEGN